MFLFPVVQNAPIRVSVDAGKPLVAVPRELFGVFFEEINRAGEGGVLAELLQNRGLAGEPDAKTGLPTGWRGERVRAGDGANGKGIADIYGGEAPPGTVTLDASDPLNSALPRSVRIIRGGDRVALTNDGFGGVPLRRGERYRLTLWIKSDVELLADVRGGGAKVLPATGGRWKRVESTFAADADRPNASLRLAPRSRGTAKVAYASLQPERTWKGHGLRPDLAERVAAMKPGFFRFPGGCYVEGNSLANAFDWKASLGPPETRPGTDRIFWGYPSSNGLGYHEYLQFCEDLGARAMYVANVGLSHSDMATLDGTGPRSMARYVQDALDAIEYANGPVTSTWGRKRAQAGHPKPFGLKYLEIGNENGYSWSFGGPAAYAPRYRMIERAVKAKYPGIVTIANQALADGGPQSYDLLSEHFYESPAWFWQNSNRYDAYDRRGPNIYVGEYAVTKGSGRGNLAGALGEAAYMTGLERNADIVRMASYAPLLENVAARQWNPNAIVFDNARSYGTPSYWVQTLFAQNRIARVLTSQTTAPAPAAPTAGGNIGLMTWNTQAEFRDISLDLSGGVPARTDAKPTVTGEWKDEGGVLSQTGPGENRRYVFSDSAFRDAKKATLNLKARKLGGEEGFIILFGGTNDADRLQWNLGGWNNTRHAFQLGGAILEPAIENLTPEQRIETGRWYDIRLEREGDRVRGYLDGKLLQEATIPTAPDLATVAGRAENGDLLIRLVNGSDAPRDAEIDLRGFRPRSGTATVLTGAPADENSFEAPEKVAPRAQALKVAPRFLHRMPPHSLTVLRLKG